VERLPPGQDLTQAALISSGKNQLSLTKRLEIYQFLKWLLFLVFYPNLVH
jgi:hypothetical protein